ncbi:hypothetical protein [Tepidibacillus marianensis]|uniref:hypothetical protein n=1 Tax=Tepidibacillus marianensis TaxID=3131995 RepID=UPI0030CE8CF1
MGHHHDDDHDHYYDDSKLHDNQFVFFQHYIQMLQTCEEGIRYISNRMANSPMLDLPMLQDCLDAYQAIDEANFLTFSIMRKIDLATFEYINEFDQLKPDLDRVKQFIETEQLDPIAPILIERLFPTYLTWSMEVQKRLIPYIQQ